MEDSTVSARRDRRFHPFTVNKTPCLNGSYTVDGITIRVSQLRGGPYEANGKFEMVMISLEWVTEVRCMIGHSFHLTIF